MVDVLDLSDEVGEMSAERGGVVIVEDVEVDAMSPAGKESRSITVTARVQSVQRTSAKTD